MRFLPFAIFMSLCAVAVVIGCDAVFDGSGSASEQEPLVEARTEPKEPIATVCTSESYWPNDPSGSPVMNPGEACISCHRKEDGPDFVLAGTVYPTLHEPDDCNGLDGVEEPATVVVEDSLGRAFEARPNAAGNFFLFSSNVQLSFPIRAKVVVGGKERVMKRTVSTGNCNSCHTERGSFSAPGRIQAP